MALIDWCGLRISIDGCRGREDELLDLRVTDRFQQRNAGGNVGIEKGSRIGNRFWYEGFGCEVENGIEMITSQHFAYGHSIPDVNLMQLCALRNGGRMPRGEI